MKAHRPRPLFPSSGARFDNHRRCRAHRPGGFGLHLMGKDGILEGAAPGTLVLLA